MVEAYRSPRQYAIGAHIGRKLGEYRAVNVLDIGARSMRVHDDSTRSTAMPKSAEARALKSLFMSVEESIVILAPIDHVGGQGSALVAPRSWSRTTRETVPEP